MANRVHRKAEQDTIGGVKLATWNKRWEVIANGFVVPQPDLRHFIGLFGAKIGGEFKYIGKAANLRGSGLSGGLSRAYVKNSSGDGGWGMKMLQEHRMQVQAVVIKLPRLAENIAVINDLKKAMIKAHMPGWNQREAVVAAARNESYRNRDRV